MYPAESLQTKQFHMSIKITAANPQMFQRFRQSDLLSPPFLHRLRKSLRHRLARIAKVYAPRFGCRDPLRLSLTDIFPFALGHIGEDLQHQIRHKSAGQIIPFFLVSSSGMSSTTISTCLILVRMRHWSRISS